MSLTLFLVRILLPAAAWTPSPALSCWENNSLLFKGAVLIMKAKERESCVLSEV
jgi:hypothetical protein